MNDRLLDQACINNILKLVSALPLYAIMMAGFYSPDRSHMGMV
jgi:hypothetical protein